MAILSPLLNGNYYDFSSVSAYIGPAKITGFKAISYTSEQQPGEVYGASRQLLGRTAGQHKASGSFEIYRPEFLDLQASLQGGGAINNLSAAAGTFPGLFEVSFPIVINFAESSPLGVVGSAIAALIQTDAIFGARITKVDQSHSQGSDALTVKCDFHAMYISYNLAIPINQLLKAAGVGP